MAFETLLVLREYSANWSDSRRFRTKRHTHSVMRSRFSYHGKANKCRFHFGRYESLLNLAHLPRHSKSLCACFDDTARDHMFPETSSPLTGTFAEPFGAVPTLRLLFENFGRITSCRVSDSLLFTLVHPGEYRGCTFNRTTTISFQIHTYSTLTIILSSHSMIHQFCNCRNLTRIICLIS